jgi:hypothetical protein
MISDQTQLAALDLAIEAAAGRRKMNAAEVELFRRHIEEIRQRIIDAAEKRNAPARRQSENAE